MSNGTEQWAFNGKEHVNFHISLPPSLSFVTPMEHTMSLSHSPSVVFLSPHASSAHYSTNTGFISNLPLLLFRTNLSSCVFFAFFRFKFDPVISISARAACFLEAEKNREKAIGTSESYRNINFEDSPPPPKISSIFEMGSGLRHKDLTFTNSRTPRYLNYESFDVLPSSFFELQRAQRASHRPSKWDDAQKWIACPTTMKDGKGGAAHMKRARSIGYGGRPSERRTVREDLEEMDIKGIDRSLVMMKEGDLQKSVDCVPETCTKAAIFVHSSITNSSINLSQKDSSKEAQNASAFASPPSVGRSVSMKDIGTQMTPIVSQEPSRTGTPVRTATPLHSPTISRSPPPGKAMASTISSKLDNFLEGLGKKGLSERELQVKTRSEIMALGTKLGKINVAAWANKKQEDKDASVYLKKSPKDLPAKSVIDIRAAAWEEAEKAKYLARFASEEIKIQAWENQLKAKAEAETRKFEVDLERMRAHAQDILRNKLAIARHKSEKKHASVEARRNRQAEKTVRQAEYMRKTGRIPSFPCWSCCY